MSGTFILCSAYQTHNLFIEWIALEVVMLYTIEWSLWSRTKFITRLLVNRFVREPNTFFTLK